MSEKKTTKELKKKSKQSVNNKKHQNNKIIKAKEIIRKQKESAEKRSKEIAESEKRSMPLRIFDQVKKIMIGILIVIFSVFLILFLVVKLNGGTPNVFGYSIQRVVSGSMEPTLMVGDIFLSKTVSDPDEIDVDDIITFQGDSNFEYHKVTHRVVVPPTANIDGEYTLITRGDANAFADEEISFDTVLSKFITKISFLNVIYDFFMSPWGLIIFASVLLMIFFDELLTFVKVVTGNYHEDEDGDGDEEDESISEIMLRIKREEEKEYQRIKEEEERKLKRRKKRSSTSKKKQKRIAEKKKVLRNQNISEDM